MHWKGVRAPIQRERQLGTSQSQLVLEGAETHHTCAFEMYCLRERQLRTEVWQGLYGRADTLCDCLP